MCRARAALLAFAIVVAGCGESASGKKPTESRLGPDGVDISAVQRAFQTSDASLRFALDDQLRLVGAAAYSDALPGLQKLAENSKTTPEQRKALQDLMQNLRALGSGTTSR